MRGIPILGLACWIVLLCTGGTRGDEEIPEAAALKTAKTEYLESMQEIRETLVAAIDKAILDAAKTGDLEEVKSLKRAKTAFEEDEALPSGTRLKGATSRYNNSIKNTTAKLNQAYEKLVKGYTRQLDIPAADKAKQEWTQFKNGKLPADMRPAGSEPEKPVATGSKGSAPGSPPATPTKMPPAGDDAVAPLFEEVVTATWGGDPRVASQVLPVDVTATVREQLRKGKIQARANFFQQPQVGQPVQNMLTLTIPVGKDLLTTSMRHLSTLAVAPVRTEEELPDGSPIRNSEFTLISATYGGSGDPKREDVTEKFAQLFQGSGIVDVSTRQFGDPAYGKVKTLETRWRVRNVILALTLEENSSINIAPAK